MKKNPSWLFIVACSVAIIITGAVLTQWAAVHADRYMRSRLMLQAVAIGRQVSIEQANALTFSLADKDSHVFQRLRSQMIAYSPAVKSSFGTEDRFLGIYSMMMREGKIFFGPENIDVKDPRSSVPGETYERPPSELLRVFASGSPLVLGPYTDEFGTFISAFAPVLDPQTGKTAIIIGIDFEAKGWKADIARASIFPVIITLLLLLVLAGSSILVFKRSRTAPEGRGSILRNADAVIAAAFGLAITLTAAYVAHINETYDHRDAFSQLAASKAFGFTQAITDIRDDYLEGFSRFIESRPALDLKEFNEYAGFLRRNYVVKAWAWIPRVPEKDREVFVRQVRTGGQTGFTLWQPDAAGEPIPAESRNEYYPICYVEPLSGNERALGFDVGSEPFRRKAFENAARTGLVTGTDAVTLVNTKDGKKGIVVFRPVYDGNGRKNLRGFTSASVVIETLLKKYISDEPLAEHPSVLIDLYEMKEGSPYILLASMSHGHAELDSVEAIVMPVFAFGKTYAVLAHRGDGFRMLYPAWAGWLTGATGIAFTASAVLFIIFLSGRRIVLEEQVLQRTEELRASEESYRKQFTDNSSVMLLIDPEDDRIIDANLSAAEFYGYPREKLCDMHGMQLDPAPGKEALKTKPFVDSGAVKYIKTRHQIAGGQVRDVEIFSSSILFGKKRLLQFIVHDITERMKMEDELKRKVAEFEIMNKVAINRELRMVELKEKIARMEEKIRKDSGGMDDKGQNPPNKILGGLNGAGGGS